MRIRFLLPAVGLLSALLSACAVVPSTAWTFDPTQPQAKPTLATADAVALTDRMAQLQLDRNAIRARIANERDALARQALYEDLHRVGMELSPLERRAAMYASVR